MSMPALLSHFGLDAARYVTTTGQVVFDGVTNVGGMLTHRSLGSVTRVANHSFHDGVEPDDVQEGDRPWWDDPGQLDRHIEAMKVSFPDFVYLAPKDGEGPCWGGTINTGRGTFEIGVFPRRDQGLPRIVVFNRRLGAPSGRRWQRSPHLYDNGNLCVADRSDWKPAEHTVATATAWAAHWLAAFTQWRMSRRWPVDGVQAVAS